MQNHSKHIKQSDTKLDQILKAPPGKSKNEIQLERENR